MSRAEHCEQFYALIDELSDRVGGARVLGECSARSGWPTRGVYFFFEEGETRSGPDAKPRVVRVGTHAVTADSKSTLWQRLRQHRGSANNGGGNHRGSVFRKLVGAALIQKDPALSCVTWGRDSSAPREVREAEHYLECLVSQYIGRMRVLGVAVDDAASTESLRGIIERNAIGLLSNYSTPDDRIDAPSEQWLGWSCPKERIQRSGLWNSNHVDEGYNPAFLDMFASLIKST